MVAWNQAKTPVKAERKAIRRLTVDKEERIRLVGDVLPRYIYWVTTKEGKRMPIECLSFNRQTEEFEPTAEDPMKQLPEEIYKEKPVFAYVCNVLHRADGEIKLHDLKSTVYRQIIDLARNPEYGNPADYKDGYDLTIKKEKTGPLPQNVKYNVIAARASTSLTEVELAKLKTDLYDLSKMYKRPTYAEQMQWLLTNTALFEGQEGNTFKPEDAEDLK